MEGYGVHTSMWTMSWDQKGCEHAVAKACSYDMDFLEIALLDPPSVDAAHSRKILEAAGMRTVCSLGLPESLGFTEPRWRHCVSEAGFGQGSSDWGRSPIWRCLRGNW